MVPDKVSPTEIPTGAINERSIISILEDLPSEDLLPVAVDIIRENRRRLDVAQSLFEQIEATAAVEAQERHSESLQHANNVALLELKIHHELVRVVIGVLGHIPELPEDRPVQ